MKNLTCLALALVVLASAAYAGGEGPDNIRRMRARMALQSDTSAPVYDNAASQSGPGSGLSAEDRKAPDTYAGQAIQENRVNYKSGHK